MTCGDDDGVILLLDINDDEQVPRFFKMSIPFPTIDEDSSQTFTAFPSIEEPRRPLRNKNRPTAFYGSPNPRAPPQPFSKSAAKRESVMALGSIQHLQHLYAKNGLASRARCV